jgi:hypothetical protein
MVDPICDTAPAPFGERSSTQAAPYGQCICSTRLKDRFPVRNSANSLIRIASPPCCGANDGSNGSEQIASPVGTEAAFRGAPGGAAGQMGGAEPPGATPPFAMHLVPRR